MRVMWFTSKPMPALARRLGIDPRGSGHWISSLLEAVKVLPELELAVVTTHSGRSDLHFREDNVDYFLVRVARRLRHFQWKEPLRRCAELARQWQPDLIHVHGSETMFGLLATEGMAPCPVVVSLQGLLCAYEKHYFGGLSLRQVLTANRLRDLLTCRGLLWDRWRLRGLARRERKILRAASYVMGRTAWDRAGLWEINPNATYYNVGEILRSPFYQRRWKLNDADRNCLFLTNARAPNNGVEILLEAMLLLKRDFPDISLRLGGQAGAGYAAFLKRHVRRLGLGKQVTFLGYLHAEALSRQLARAHVFVLPSWIENSPNSLAEAMAMGLPCVASRVGGVPSMIEEEQTGLLANPGNAAKLAGCIRSLLNDDRMAVRLGQAARDVAIKRHHPDDVIAQLLQAYRRILRPGDAGVRDASFDELRISLSGRSLT